MSRLKLWQKIFIIVAMLGLPLIVITREYVKQIKEQSLNHLKEQRAALPALKHVGELTKVVQDHGANLPLWIIGSDIAPDQNHESAERIETMLALVDQDLAKLKGVDISQWKVLSSRIKDLHSDKETRPRGFSAYADVSGDLINFAEILSYDAKYFSGAGNLIMPSRLAIELTLSLAENLNLLRGYVAFKVFVGEKSLKDVATTSSYLSLADNRYKEILQSLEDLDIHNPELYARIKPEMEGIEKELSSVHAMVEHYDSDAPLSLDPAVFFNESTKLISSIYNLHSLSVNFIEEKLGEEIRLREARLEMIIGTAICSVLIVLAFVVWISRSFVRGVREIEFLAEQVASGNRSLVFPAPSGKDEVQSILGEIHKIYVSICASERKSSFDNWMLGKQKELNESIRGESDPRRFAVSCLHSVADTLGTDAACFYRSDEGRIELLYALGFDTPNAMERPASVARAIARDQGLRVIQASEIPAGYSRSETNNGRKDPRYLLIFPIRFQEEAIAVMEFLFWEPVSAEALHFLQATEENIGVLFASLLSNMLVSQLLQTTQKQSEELQDANSDLEEKTQLLNEQQLTLQDFNQELEERRTELESQNETLERVIENLASAKREAEEKGREAEVANRYKSIFLANMSHELRTPLNSILILAQVLADNRDKTMSEGQMKNANIIYRSGQDLLKLINEILDLSRIEAGKIEVNPVAMDVEELADETKAMYRALASNKNLKYTVELAAGYPKDLETDAVRIAQIIRNLVANAIKFTEEGYVAVTFSAATDPAYHLQIEVRDSGIGIPLEQQGLIFEPFKQLNNSLSRSQDGTGLGLSISKNLASKLGGMIQVESRPGQGSRFTLLLPRRTPKEHEAPAMVPDALRLIKREGEPPRPEKADARARGIGAPQVSAASIPVFEGRHILAVDDEPRNIYALTQILDGLGCVIHGAASGMEALQKVSSLERFDLILMDIMMPEMDGYETMRRIRSMAAGAKLPIIALTAKAMESDREQCLEAGANDYLVKPVDTAKLIMLLRVWLSP